MNLVDEEHLAVAEIRENGGQIARLLQHRPRGGANRRAQLVGDHVGERGLAETRRAVQQHVIERFAALTRRRDRHLQVLANAILPDVVVNRARPQAGFVLRVFLDARGRDDT